LFNSLCNQFSEELFYRLKIIWKDIEKCFLAASQNNEIKILHLLHDLAISLNCIDEIKRESG